jgi:uncharacterized protein
MANRLANETSPYLLQHADNPVDWYPWGEEALQKAFREDKPILLSIGYAACHWCHVMAHESFEDPETAAFMNEHFINIKVDREERPDLDSIYMNAVVALTGQGGWPMTVALTASGEPFFGGTYFPPSPRFGMPSFKQVLASLVRAWQEQRQEIADSAAKVAGHLQRPINLAKAAESLDESLFQQAETSLERSFDPATGGFGRAPKFPQAMAVEFLLRRYLATGNRQARHMAEFTLEHMAYGGIYDQLGGGFARYSTDNDWLVPHFEKMLYDNGLLARVYLHAWQITGRPLYRRIVEETLDWILAEMAHEAGGFYSSLDADSEGEEGRFYVWQAAEIQDLLGEDAELFAAYYGVTPGGNWEGKNILHVSRSIEEAAQQSGVDPAEAQAKLSLARQKLYAVRAQRVWPSLDDKVLVAWNGLVLSALAEAGTALSRPDYTAAAIANAEFIFQHLRTPEGRLLRTWKAGSKARFNAYLEDYTYLADGLLALYQDTFDSRWFSWAHELADMIHAYFTDEKDGGFFDTSDDHEALIHRPKDLQDNAAPSGNAMAANVLLRLALFTGQSHHWEVAERAVASIYGAMAQYPTGFAHWLCAADLIVSRPREVAVVGNPTAPDTLALVGAVRREYRPNIVLAVGRDDQTVPLLAGRSQLEGRATAYVCRNFACQMPTTDVQELERQLVS